MAPMAARDIAAPGQLGMRCNRADPLGRSRSSSRLGCVVPTRVESRPPGASNFQQPNAVEPTARTLAALVARRPALGERGEAFVAIFGEQRPLVALALDRERLVQRRP